MSLAFQWPYRQARDGIWGTQTSTLNWCEEDYNITYYCAEFINTVSNLNFLHLGLVGIRDCLRYDHGGIYIMGYLGYIVVGLGSMAFHATLKYSMQLADELPMIYTTCIIAFATFSYARPKRTRIAIGLFIVGLALWITAYYLMSQDPVFHQVAYGLLTCAVVFRGMYVMEVHLRPALRARNENPVHADELMNQMWKMAVTGIVFFLIGFFIWNVDNIFCRHLLIARNSMLLPWAAVLEGHAWWHLFTSVGAYYFIIWRVWLERCLGGGDREFMLHWPSPFTSVPRVIPRSQISTKANGNGSGNGNGNGHGPNGTNGSIKKIL